MRRRSAGYTLGAENEAIRRSIGILTETPGLYDRLSAWQNLLFFAQMYDVPEKQAQAQVTRYLRMPDLWDRRDDKVGGFSKGMRQKLAIARALLHEPPIVFLDEPTAGLDPEAARTVLDFVKQLRAEGRTIFLTTHNLPEADEVCDLIGIFSGRLLRLDTPQQLRTGLFGRGTVVQSAHEAAAFVGVVQALPFVHQAAAQTGTLSVELDDPDEQNPALVQALVEAGARIRSVGAIDHSLEEVYMELVGNSQGEEAQP